MSHCRAKRLPIIDVLCSARLFFRRVAMRLFFYFCLLIAPPALADQTADFLAARDAFRAGDAVKLGRFAQRLKNTPLEVYASYYGCASAWKTPTQAR